MARSAPPSSLPILLLANAAIVVGLPLLSTAPNRLLSGKGQHLLTVLEGLDLQPFGLVAVLALCVLVAGLWLRPAEKLWPTLALGWIAVLWWGLLVLTGTFATSNNAATEGLGRTTLSSGFWLGLLTAWMVASDALRRLASGPRQRWFYWALLLGGIGLLLFSGSLDSLSYLKEYANRQEDFWRFLAQHLRITGITVALTLVLGLPLGIALHRQPHWAQRVFPVLNMVQTIPSIALFGLLMAALAWLGAVFPVLPAWGIQGIGLAPAVLALTAYSLLPLVRSTFEGLGHVPQSVTESGRAVGLSANQLLWQVEFPLAAPVILSGLKVMLVQTIGLTAVAALIGAGGLGSLMFEGLFSSAVDLVVLAVVPIVTLAWFAEAFFMAVNALLPQWTKP